MAEWVKASASAWSLIMPGYSSAVAKAYENRDGDASWRAGHLIGPYAVGDSPSIDEAKRAASKAVAERIIAGLELMP